MLLSLFNLRFLILYGYQNIKQIKLFIGDKCFYLSNENRKDDQKQVVSYQCCPKVPEKDKRVSILQRDDFLDEGPCFSFPVKQQKKNQKLVTSKTFRSVPPVKESKATKDATKTKEGQEKGSKQKQKGTGNAILDTSSFEKWIKLIQCIFTDSD